MVIKYDDSRQIKTILSVTALSLLEPVASLRVDSRINQNALFIGQLIAEE